MVNVSVDGKNIIRHKRINLSFATALDDGNLIVPVIKNADTLNISGLQKLLLIYQLVLATKSSCLMKSKAEQSQLQTLAPLAHSLALP